MAVSHTEAKSLLAMDVGSTSTRALLFDAVEGRYRFLGEGRAPTTVAAPLHDVSEGVRIALDQLQSIAGRVIVDSEEELILPGEPDGTGVDTFVATLSAGPPLRVFAVGLLENVSLRSARNLVTSTYAQLVGSITLGDSRKIEEQIDFIMRSRPDLIIIAGGTEDGATKSVLKLIEPVGLACYLMPEGHKPEVLFTGNHRLAEDVKSTLEKLVRLHIAPNVRPHLDKEQLAPAQAKLVEIYRQVRSRKLHGVQELAAWSGEQLVPTATAFGRVVRFLSKVYDSSKGVLGVDVGASTTTIAAAFAGELKLGVYPDLGMGESLARILHRSPIEAITRWIPFDISQDDIRNYVYNKTLAPASLPVTPEELAIDQALARQVLASAVRATRQGFPATISAPRPDLMPWFEPIVAAGKVLTDAPTHGQSLMMLLDAIQPTGVTTLVLDQNNLSPALGAAASVNPVLTVQVLESGTFLNLCTVISPVGSARPGTPILQLRLDYEAGGEMKLDVKNGAFETLQLPIGQVARLHLQPLQRFDVGMGGPGRGGSLRVVGGALGVVIDARGRPLQLPVDSGRRYDLLKKWLWTLGG